MEILEWCKNRRLSENLTNGFIDYVNKYSRRLFFKDKNTQTTDLFISRMSSEQIERYWKWYVTQLKSEIENLGNSNVR
jgi:hypothetical protein